MASEFLGLDPILVIFILIVAMPMAFILILVMSDMLTNKKAKVLYCETEKTGKFLDLKVQEGAIQHKKKKYFVDQAQDLFTVPSGIIVKSFRPLYVIKWDRVVPFKFIKEGLKMEHSAENFKNLIENKTLDALLKGGDSNKQALLFFIIGAVMGSLIGYVIATNV